MPKQSLSQSNGIRLSARKPIDTAIRLLAVMVFLSYLSPQVSLYGHGLRLALPAGLLLLVCAYLRDRKALYRGLYRFRAVFVLTVLFCLQGSFRFAPVPFPLGANLAAVYVWPLWQILFLLAIVAYLVERGVQELAFVRRWVLIGWGISLAVGVPFLLATPGLARTTMSNLNEAENWAAWAPYGIANYGGYTALALMFLPLLFTACAEKSRWRIVMLLAVFGSAFAVLLSTFTMATFVLLLSALCAFVYWVFRGGYRRMAARLAIMLLAFLSLPSLFLVSRAVSPQFSFASDKMLRLATGISESGLAEGDETGRGFRFEASIEGFVEQPFLGYLEGISRECRVGWHSSLADTLVLFGVVFGGLWMGALYQLFRIAWYSSPTPDGRLFAVVLWVLLLLTGILNPTWYSPIFLGAILLYTINPAVGRRNHSLPKLPQSLVPVGVRS